MKKELKEKILHTTNYINLIDFKDLTDREIKNNYRVARVDDVALVLDNKDLIRRLVNFSYSFISKDYEALKKIESILPEDNETELILDDDFKNSDRSYIDGNSFQNSRFIVPLSYLMWDIGIKKNGGTYVSNVYNPDGIHYRTAFGGRTVSAKDLVMFKKIITDLVKTGVPNSKIQEIILVSDYLQDLVQYVGYDNISRGEKGIYITNSLNIKPECGVVHDARSVLFQNFGVCEAIADATTILLNNPVLDVNARTAFGQNHVYNVINIAGKWYYVDNTWSITRNKKLYEESLKAKAFSSEYLLFGSNRANEMGHHIPESIVPMVEVKDYDHDKIDEEVKTLVKTKRGQFTNYKKPVFESYLLQMH